MSPVRRVWLALCHFFPIGPLLPRHLTALITAHLEELIFTILFFLFFFFFCSSSFFFCSSSYWRFIQSSIHEPRVLLLLPSIDLDPEYMSPTSKHKYLQMFFSSIQPLSSWIPTSTVPFGLWKCSCLQGSWSCTRVFPANSTFLLTSHLLVFYYIQVIYD